MCDLDVKTRVLKVDVVFKCTLYISLKHGIGIYRLPCECTYGTLGGSLVGSLDIFLKQSIVSGLLGHVKLIVDMTTRECRNDGYRHHCRHEGLMNFRSHFQDDAFYLLFEYCTISLSTASLLVSSHLSGVIFS